ncbi:MAG TPA: ABC transporter ATP-binding protein/permease [Burkholderiales bacterium]|jgi:putative ATP-binding cassette transporter
MLKNTKTLLADIWTLAKPYWFSEEKWAARGLLAAIVALNLLAVYINVLINAWNNDFYNTLQHLDKAGFFHQLLKFTGLAVAAIIVAVYALYLRQMLQMRWRRWLTMRYLGEWVGTQAHYRMQLSARQTEHGTKEGTDNPDQRISEDLNAFCANTLILSLGLLSAVVSLVSFSTILWRLSGALQFTLAGTQYSIPGYMYWFALLYAGVGSLLMYKLGRPLVGLTFTQQQREADFRFSLVRVRENSESIALYRGERDENAALKLRLGDVVENWWAIMRRQKTLKWFSAGYGQFAIIFPFLVAAPRYFSKAIELGGLMQIASAFGEVQDALSWFISAYTDLAAWKATTDRLIKFHHATGDAQRRSAAGEGITLHEGPAGTGYALAGANVSLPQGGKTLLEHLDLTLAPTQSVFVTGPSGSGKSTLFRAFAGIWPFGKGEVLRPANTRTLFLPQKPYLTIGSLREQLLYPHPPQTPGDDALRAALADCGLPHFAARLDEQQHWAQLLSGGEQQRIAIARALLHRPDWLFLDEATSALDEEAEMQLYQLLKERLPGTAIISIGHRAGLAQFHQRHLKLTGTGEEPRQLAWAT